ncbi:MAG: 16S rRNA (guanine(966)-N(2))-methyltransferase RsmD [Rhizomicrobium sp.]
MRIVGGALGGRVLHAPEDSRVRPTSDKVRQAIFNVLAHGAAALDLDGIRVIDLFAGTGALGIEAISRGAAFALFVDDSAESRALIRRNVEAFALTGASKIWRRDATDLGPMAAGAGGPFGLAFLDPPYRKGLAGSALGALRGGGWLAPDAIAVAEIAADEDVPSTDGFALLDSRTYGETQVCFLRAS